MVLYVDLYDNEMYFCFVYNFMTVLPAQKLSLVYFGQFEDDVYLPTDEPHGSIQATLSRLWSKM